MIKLVKQTMLKEEDALEICYFIGGLLSVLMVFVKNELDILSFGRLAELIKTDLVFISVLFCCFNFRCWRILLSSMIVRRRYIKDKIKLIIVAGVKLPTIGLLIFALSFGDNSWIVSFVFGLIGYHIFGSLITAIAYWARGGV